MHDPVQSALHLVAQEAVVGTETHCVVQWSSQHAPQDAWQSADDDAETAPPSDAAEDDALDVHDALQPASQRVWQSVVQSNMGGLVAQLVVQSAWQVETQVASAEIVHCELQVCSSLAAHASSQLAGAHCVAQSFCTTTEHCALASISMFPHAEISALAAWGHASSATKGNVATVLRTQRFVLFMVRVSAIGEPRVAGGWLDAHESPVCGKRGLQSAVHVVLGRAWLGATSLVGHIVFRMPIVTQSVELVRTE